MANNTDPLTGSLNSPTDYQRPVATRSNGVDIFGQAANLVGGIDSALSSGRKAAGPSATETENLLVKRGTDEYAQGVMEIMTGRPVKEDPHGFKVSVLENYGADVQSAMEEMKRVQAAQDAGGTSQTLAEIQIERLTNNISGRHPELSAEILGSVMASFGIDHSYARTFKANQALGDLITQSNLDAQKSFADLAVKAGAVIKGMPWDMQVQKGQEIARYNDAIAKETENRRIAKENNEAQAAGLKATAEQQAAFQKRSDGILVESYLGVASATQYGTIAMFRDLKSVGAEDASVTKEIGQAIDIALSRSADDESIVTANLRANGVGADGLKRVEDWYKERRSMLEEMRSGSSSNYALTTNNMKMLSDLHAVSDVDLIPTYNRLTGLFGKELVGNILAGTMQGFPPETVKGLRDEMLAAFDRAQGDTAKINKAALDFKANLSGANIHDIPDPAKRAEAAQQASLGLWGSMNVLSKAGAGTTASTQAKDTFNNTSISLAGLALQEGAIITPEAASAATGLLFGAKWRGAMYEYAKTGDQAKVDMGVRYNGVAAGSVLDSMKSQFVNRGLVQYNAASGNYEAVKEFSLHPALSDMPKRIEAANTMNKILNHLVSLDGLGGVQLVPPEALKSTDSEGKTTKLSTREIFATTQGLQQSLLNWGNNLEKAENLDAIAQAHKTLNEYMDPSKNPATDYSSIRKDVLEANLRAAEIDSNVSKYTGPSYVSVNSLEDYKSRIGGTEASGNENIGAHDPSKSSAFGIYGFLDSTWLGIVKSIPGNENLTDTQALNLRKDRGVTEKVMDIFTNRNIKALREGLGRDVSWDEVDMAHLLGSGGAVNVVKALQSNPSTKISQVLSSDVIKANSNGKNGLMDGDPTVLQLWNRRLKRQDPSWASYMQQAHGVSVDTPKTNWTGAMSGDDIELPKQ